MALTNLPFGPWLSEGFDAKMKDDNKMLEFMRQYFKYLNDSRFKIERFTHRELRKLRILNKLEALNNNESVDESDEEEEDLKESNFPKFVHSS